MIVYAPETFNTACIHDHFFGDFGENLAAVLIDTHNQHFQAFIFGGFRRKFGLQTTTSYNWYTSIHSFFGRFRRKLIHAKVIQFSAKTKFLEGCFFPS